jgi:hypothetical protein
MMQANEKTEQLIARASTIHDTLARCHPALEAGKVYCTTCGRKEQVDSADCLRHGWPKCCGATMRLGSQ